MGNGENAGNQFNLIQNFVVKALTEVRKVEKEIPVSSKTNFQNNITNTTNKCSKQVFSNKHHSHSGIHVYAPHPGKMASV